MAICLKFAIPISEVYRDKLQTFVDSLLALGLTENQPPSIQFPGMNSQTISGLSKLQIADYYRYKANRNGA